MRVWSSSWLDEVDTAEDVLPRACLRGAAQMAGALAECKGLQVLDLGGNNIGLQVRSGGRAMAGVAGCAGAAGYSRNAACMGADVRRSRTAGRRWA